jgi:hypothetical protein
MEIAEVAYMVGTKIRTRSFARFVSGKIEHRRRGVPERDWLHVKSDLMRQDPLEFEATDLRLAPHR